MPELKELGKRIKALRKRVGLSQEALALNAGVDYSYIGRIERGENNPTYLMLLKIADQLQVGISEII